MTYEQLVKANSTITTTPIRGKNYAEVPERVRAFRMVYPNGGIATEIISNENGVVVIKAMVFDEAGNILGVGHAYEKEGSTFINKESYIENCETSAVGRALGFVGFGIETSICSAEELQNAIVNQNGKVRKEQIDKLKALADEKGVYLSELTRRANINDIAEMDMKTWVNAVNYLESIRKER